MNTGWAIAAIIGAFVLGAIVGVVAVASARRKARFTDGPVGRSDGASVDDVSVRHEVGTLASSVMETKRPTRVSRTRVPHSRAEPDSPSARPTVPSAAPAPRPGYVITSAGEPESAAAESSRTEFTPRPALDQLARAAMIEAASLAHGVRAALSEENRARISYEIKRELIRVRKTRKFEVREALREYRAKHRAPVDGGEES